MPVQVEPRRRIATTLSWPFGMAWTTWHYMWRILPVYRVDREGTLPDDLPPPLPDGVSRAELQLPEHGAGPLLHRTYTGRVRDARLGAEEVIGIVSGDPNRVAPGGVARFHKAAGSDGVMHLGDEFLVHMPGPWNGPVRTVEVRPDGFRFATLAGHLEAGQIEWRAWDDGGLCFAVESWSRAGDRFSAFLHDRLRMAKEVQLYMWTTVVERVSRLAGGRLLDGVQVETRRVPPRAFG